MAPISVGDAALREVDPGVITSLSPLAGGDVGALKAAHGMAFPAPGRASGKAGARAVWSGRGQAFLIGPAPDAALKAHFAMTDQSDGWAVLGLEGTAAREVLARLCPLDLRPDRFKRGHTARTLIGHMTGSVTRVGADSFDLMVFRSMAQTAVHEIEEAMKSVAARG
nr:sarcosine oxidase subunit gamma family protein [Aliiroseovarius subalbicans]